MKDYVFSGPPKEKIKKGTNLGIELFWSLKKSTIL